MKTLLLGIFILVFYSNCISQDQGNFIVDHRVDSKELHSAATLSLKGYVDNYLNKENVQRFGFSSIEEAKSSTMGDPMQLLMIGLTDIQKYEKGSNPKAILTDVSTWWFPVINGNTVKTKLEMIEKDGKFLSGELGGVKSVTTVMNSRQDLLTRLKERDLTPSKQVGIIKIPALMIMLTIAQVGDALYVVPVTGSPELYGMKQGQLIKLEEALLRIKVEAVKADPKKTM